MTRFQYLQKISNDSYYLKKVDNDWFLFSVVGFPIGRKTNKLINSEIKKITGAKTNVC